MLFGMPVQRIESLDHPGLAAYRNLKDKELARDGRRFIAEGEQVVRRLIASGLPVESILLSDRKAALAELAPKSAMVWIAPDALVRQIIGFEFHSGVMAVGIRPAPRPWEAVIPDVPRLTLAIAQQITNTDNLGSLIRTCAAMDIDALLLGERCCDPWFRHAVRVSMGTVFCLPIVQCTDLLSEMAALKQRRQVELIATTLDPGAQPLTAYRRGARVGIVFGSEADGLDAETLAACDGRVTIPMRRQTDSLNVAVAAGIILHYFSDVLR